MRIPGSVAFVMLIFLALTDSVRATTCLELALLPQLLADDHVSLVFQGTVIDRQPVSLPRPWTGTITTFEVTRVWKGQPGKTVKVNFSESLSNYAPELRKDVFVVASLQSARERQQWSVPPDAEATFGTSVCGTFPFESPMARRIIAGAPGLSPR